jgi:hypothetical protein
MVSLSRGIIGVAVLAAAVLAGTSFAGTAATASFVLNQTCSNRIAPNSQASVNATMQNNGDEALVNVVLDGDAGTPGTEGDDFRLTRTGGDNGNNVLDPGETWTFGGSYRIGTDDSTNVVNAEATSVLGGDPIDELDTCTTDAIQPPVPGVRAGARPVRGRVLVKLPGTNTFVQLTGATEIPIGAEVDTRAGAVQLTSGGGGGTATFFDGLFTITQARAARAVMTLNLKGGNFAVCRRRGSSAQSVDAVRPKRPVRRLWGSGRGRFTTRARYSSATVRGTRWLVQDRCDGTLTRVTQGRVLVRDFVRRRNRIVRAGQTYLARAPGR